MPSDKTIDPATPSTPSGQMPCDKATRRRRRRLRHLLLRDLLAHSTAYPLAHSPLVHSPVDHSPCQPLTHLLHGRKSKLCFTIYPSAGPHRGRQGRRRQQLAFLVTFRVFASFFCHLATFLLVFAPFFGGTGERDPSRARRPAGGRGREGTRVIRMYAHMHDAHAPPRAPTPKPTPSCARSTRSTRTTRSNTQPWCFSTPDTSKIPSKRAARGCSVKLRELPAKRLLILIHMHRLCPQWWAVVWLAG